MVSVAVDVGPLHGHRTGIGNAVAWLLADLEDRPDLDVLPYVTSARARLAPPQRRLPIPGALAKPLWSRLSVPAMDRWLGHPDVVHGTNYVVPPTRCARLVSVYDCWFLEHPELADPDVRRAGAVLRRAVADGAVVVTSSAATTERARLLLDAADVRTIHLGPPPVAAPPTAADGGAPNPEATGDRRLAGPFVLALGTIERRKNLPTLIDAFEVLADHCPDIALVVAGIDGDASGQVSGRIAGLPAPVAERVVRLQRVDAGLKAWLLTHASVLAYPSLAEGFGFPILEAQQAGLPVVGAAAGSIPEIAGDGALLGPPDDAEALAANLASVLEDGALRADLVDRGRRNVERFSWRAMGALERYERVRPAGSAAATRWFNLGDQDLATHLYRTARLAEGASLTAVTDEIRRAWDVPVRMLPMTDDRFATVITTLDHGDVAFQDYFVRLRHEVPVSGFRFDGDGRATTATTEALAADTIVIAPSNPLVSIGPIRALPGIDGLLAERRDRVVAVSPIVGGAALRGPAARMLAELGHEPSVVGVARIYAPVASVLVIDPADAGAAAAVEDAGMRAVVVPSIMSSPAASRRLALAAVGAIG